MAEHTRRRLLAASGAGAIVAVAGCLGGDDGDDGADEENGDDENGDFEPESDVGSEIDSAVPLLGNITLNNLDSQSHTVSVIVEVDGRNVAWTDQSLDAGEGGVSLDRDWSDDAGNFRVTVRVDGSDLREVRPGDWNDPSCVNLVILVGDGGSLQIAGDTIGGPCDPSS